MSLELDTRKNFQPLLKILEKLALRTPWNTTALFTRCALTVLCSKRCQKSQLNCGAGCSEDERQGRGSTIASAPSVLRHRRLPRAASFSRFVPSYVLRCRNEGCVRWNDEVVEGKRERKRGTTTHVTSVVIYHSYIQWRALFAASKRRWISSCEWKDVPYRMIFPTLMPATHWEAKFERY